MTNIKHVKTEQTQPYFQNAFFELDGVGFKVEYTRYSYDSFTSDLILNDYYYADANDISSDSENLKERIRAAVEAAEIDDNEDLDIYLFLRDFGESLRSNFD